MKPFNLEQARKQNGEGLITRDGRPARIICWDRKSKDYPLVALVEEEGGYESHISYTLNGRVFLEEEHEYDLFLDLAPTKHEGWVNVYRDNYGNVSAGEGVYRTKQDAERTYRRGIDRVACTHIEWEE